MVAKLQSNRAHIEPLLVEPRDAFKALALGETVGRALMKSGAIPSVQLGSRRLIPIAELKRLASVVPQN